MKKIFACLFLCATLLGAVACTPKQNQTLKKVTYYCGETVFSVEEISVGESIDLANKTFEKGVPQKSENENFSYTFSGWGFSEDGEKLQTLQISDDITLYALFEAHEKEHEGEFTVTFLATTDEGEKVLSTQKVKSGEKAVPPTEIPAPEGYRFAGWDIDPAVTPITARMQFKALYEKMHFMLYKHALGEIYEEEIEFETPIELSAPTPVNAFCFVGWYNEKDLQNSTNITKMPAHDVHIYAKYGVNFASSHLSFPANAVYGGENAVRVLGLPQAKNLSYSYLWQDKSNGETLNISSAGEHEISVKITAEYKADEESFTDATTLTKTVSVSPKRITLNLNVDDIEYGSVPEISFSCDGLVKEEDAAQIAPVYGYYDEEGNPQTLPLPAGEYHVEANIPVSQNYEVVVEPVSFTVHKKVLTVSAEAENTVYGNAPNVTLSFSGFVLGENEDILQENGEEFFFQQDGGTITDRLFVGEYQLIANAEAFSAQNYEIIAASAVTFEVTKAPLEITVSLEKQELLYGELPNPEIRRTPFCYEDETEEEVFGAPLTVAYSGENPFHVGDYEASVRMGNAPQNYEVTANTVSFSVAPKPLTVTPVSLSMVFGEEFDFSAPVVEGVIQGEEYLAEEIISAIFFELKKDGESLPIGRFLRAGEYAIVLNLDESAFPDYGISCVEGSLTIKKRPFTIRSGEVSQNRNTEWSYSPELSGAEAELFDAAGQLILNTKDAGTYTAAKEEELAQGKFEWRTPLVFSLKDGTDVTDSFKVHYALKVTLNNSRFNITLPFTELTLTYDGVLHEYPVQIALDAGDGEDVAYSVNYKINGTPVEKPAVKNAGQYEISCEISAENYDTEVRSYQVTVEKANYILQGELNAISAVYDGKTHGEEPHVSGVGGEDVSEYCTLSVSFTPTHGEKIEYSGWISPRDAGRYEISLCASGNLNYEDYVKSFTVDIARAQYKVTAENQVYTYTPGSSFGTGVTVEVISGNNYTVSYEWNDENGMLPPRFSEAIPEGITVQYIVSESNNYEEKIGEYSVVIYKRRGELDLAGIQKTYRYNGLPQSIESGATSNNREDGVISYENNVFTTVAEGNALVLTVRLSEGKNYTGDEKTLAGFTVEKQTFTALPVELPQIYEQYNALNKRLSNVQLPGGFRWVNGDEALTLGTREYAAIYNPDSENCNDFALKLSFVTRRERVTAEFYGGEGDIGGSNFTLADFRLIGEDDRTLSDEERLSVTLRTSAEIDENTGGTYPVVCELTVASNNYFELTENVKVVPFKLKSVDVDGCLYTAEDALKLLESGMATVRTNTSFLTEAVQEQLGYTPYEGDEYYTVKSGTKLLVPYKENDTGSTAQNAKQAHSAVTGEGYATLILPKGRGLNVEGTLIVNALRSSDGQRTSMVVGENFGALHLEENASVHVKDGGVFESMGFTYGAGDVYAESGSKLYEPFAMAGWKGGSISSAIRNDVFPLNQYTLTSFEAKTHFMQGAKYSLRASVSATLSVLGGEQNLDLEVVFLGDDESAFIQLSEGEIVKIVQLEDGKIMFDATGEVSFHNLELKLSSTIKFNTSGLQVPIPGNVQIHLQENCEAVIPNKVALKFLPGATAKIAEGATLTIADGGALYGYGKDNVSYADVSLWQDGGNGLTYPCAALAGAYRNAVNEFGYTAASPALIEVGGVLNVENGGTLAAEITKREGGDLSFSEGAKKEGTISEDKTPVISSTTGKLQALSGKGGTFFKATLRAYQDGVAL